MSFATVMGQERAVDALRRAIRSGRVAHAYLFAGPAGVGKMTTALEFAKALVCVQASDDACDRCRACRKVVHGNHPDVHRLAPEGPGRQIKLDPVRDHILAQLALKSYEAPRQVAVLDDADGLNEEAANCLLKTLEEPPNAVLILVTARADALPETIVSRCQMIRFASLTPELLQQVLEARGVERETAQFLARSSGGSVGRAVRMSAEAKLPQFRRDLLGLLTALTEGNVVTSAARFAELTQELARSRTESDEADETAGGSRAEARSAAESLLDLGVLFYRDVALRQIGSELARLPNADLDALLEQETGVRAGAIRAILDTMEEAKRLVRANVDADAIIVDAFADIAAFRAERAA